MAAVVGNQYNNNNNHNTIPLNPDPVTRGRFSVSTTSSSSSSNHSSLVNNSPQYHHTNSNHHYNNSPAHNTNHPIANSNASSSAPATQQHAISSTIASSTSGTGELPRQRQQHSTASTPITNTPSYHHFHNDIKDTQHVPSQPNFETNHINSSSPYRNNLISNNGHSASAYTNGNPNLGGLGLGAANSNGNANGTLANYTETPLSTFLSRSFAQARKSFGAPPIKVGSPAFSKSSLSTTTTSSTGGVQSTLASIRESVPFIMLCSAWYMSSAMSSNTGKSILTRFRYPVTLTFVQFAFVAGYCVLILAARERIASGAGTNAAHPSLSTRRGSLPVRGWGIRKPSKSMFHGTLVMSLFQIAGHVFSSMAIARVPVSTVHTIKALSPLFTVIAYAALFRVSYSSATYFALLPLTLGVMLACSFDLRANAVGFLCALGSTLVFVSQNIFSKKLLPKESGSGVAVASSGANSGKLDKLNLLFYSSGMAFVLMIPIWAYSDGRTLLFKPTPAALANAPPGTTASLAFNFFLNGTVHFAQNLLAFSILARTSPVTYSIASLVKRIAVICIAILWSGQSVSFIQGIGMTMTFAGLWMYNRAKSDVDKGERKRGQVEKRQEMFLPTTAGDARDLEGVPTPPPGGLGISNNHHGAAPSHLSNGHAQGYVPASAYTMQPLSPPQHYGNPGMNGNVGPPLSRSIGAGTRQESPSGLNASTSLARNRNPIPNSSALSPGSGSGDGAGRKSWESPSTTVGSGGLGVGGKMTARNATSPKNQPAQIVNGAGGPGVPQSSVRYL